MPSSRRRAALVVIFMAQPAAHAGEADVIDARMTCADGTCSVTATVRHADSGWDHYADHFRVLTDDDQEIARRVLCHPHVDEQPFTRGLGSVRVPDGAGQVWIEAHDSVHGYGGKRLRLAVPGR